MQSIAVQHAGVGMLLARDVIARGRIICRAGTTLSRRDIENMTEAGIRTIYITTNLRAPRRLERDQSIIPTETFEATRTAVREFLTKIKDTLDIDTRPVITTVTKVVDAILERPKVVLALEDIRSQKDYVYGHCVAVCTLSILMGMDLGLLYRDLKALGTGALLHDVGKVAIDDPVWTKPGKLTEEEYELVKTHTTLGFEILRRRRELDLRAAHIAYQHHERFDGKGYPRGLQGDEILLFARIVSIADVFNALMSDRPYRDAWPVEKALNLIKEDTGSAFDPNVVRTFLSRVKHS